MRRSRLTPWVVTIVALLVVVGALVFNTYDHADVIPALRRARAAEPPASVRAEVWTAVNAFYDARGDLPGWVTGRTSGDAQDALGLLRSAPAHGLSSDDYGEATLAQAIHDVDKSSHPDEDVRLAALAELDLALTTAVLSLGRDVALGSTSPGRLSSTWKARRESPDLAGTLAGALNDDLHEWLNAISPPHPEYAALRTALGELLGAWPADASHEDRLARLRVNLDRWRWMPDDLGDLHVLVNIPAYALAVREHGTPVLAMRTIVGKPENRTPVFSADMNAVVFSPYWNIPESIADLEIAPAIVRDPAYLARQNIEVLRVAGDGATAVDPFDVDWENPEALQELAFRQRPGPGNALGHVKFLLPNPYAIYLHDTPADKLFERERRAFSHGCIRLHQPEALAEYLLRSHSGWDTERIRTAMHSGTQRAVELEEPIPVHLVYFTAWPGDNGVHFFDDVYRYDARQIASLKRPAR
jgi:murein L,D-transpeptidase YcbB/YkuD